MPRRHEGGKSVRAGKHKSKRTEGRRRTADTGKKDGENWFDGFEGLGYSGRGEKATDVNVIGLVQDKLKPVSTERHDSDFSRSDNP